MNLLLDTHILLWAATEPERIPPATRDLIENPETTLFFSAASIWEVAIKRGLQREDFQVDAQLLRRGLLENGYQELVITSAHAAYVQGLEAIHKDPFDRLLIAQATLEAITLVTGDETVARYSGPIRKA